MRAHTTGTHLIAERDPVIGVDHAVAERRERLRRVQQGWHSVTEVSAGGVVYDVCPACWLLHSRPAHEYRRVRVNPPIVAGVRCYWCDARRGV